MGDTGVLLTRARKGAEDRSILWRASIVLMLAWFAFVLRAAYLLAKEGTAELAGRVAARTWPGQLESLCFVAPLAAVIVVPVLVARAARPALAVPTLAIIGGIVTLALAVGAEAIIDLSLFLWLGLACHELGRLALAALRLPTGDRLDAFVLRAGLGTVLLSLGGLVLRGVLLFDRRLFMYYEDFDLTLRRRGAGWTIAAAPASIVHHKRSQAVEGASKRPLLFHQFHANHNRVKLLAKYYPLGVLLRSLPLIGLSLAYWNAAFLRWGGPRYFRRAVGAQLRFAFKGVGERLRGGGVPAETVLPWMTEQRLRDVLALRREFAQYVE